MIYLPIAAFLVGIAWLIRQGFREKAEYLRRRAEEQQSFKARRDASSVPNAMTPPAHL
jgi:hypothetical protein